MIRLMLVLSPAASILAGIGASFLVTGLHADRTIPSTDLSGCGSGRVDSRKRRPNTFPFSLTFSVLLIFFWMCSMLQYMGSAVHHPLHMDLFNGFLEQKYFSREGGPIGPSDMPKPDDFREAYHWLRQNTHPKAKLMAWWDYGYQVSEVGNRTVLVDNNTWNSTHIATVGLAFASDEYEAHSIVQNLDVDYVFVVFGGMSRFASDDLNKLLWMVRIASGVYPSIQQSDFLGRGGQYTVGIEAPTALKKSLMYKLSYHRFGQATKGFDFARKVQVDASSIQLDRFEEVYTTENWIVRIYKVLKTNNRDTRMHNAIESALM